MSSEVQFYNEANRLRREGRLDEAIAAYSRAIRLNNGFFQALHNRGEAYSAKGQYDLAIADYTDVIKLRPTDTLPYVNRGNVHAYKGSFDAAIADYGKALEIDPGCASALEGRGNAYSGKKDYSRAVKDYAAALRIEPGRESIFANMQRALGLLKVSSKKAPHPSSGAHVFVSYMREDQESVRRLCSELRARNIEVWLDRDSIDPGRSWRMAIRSAVEKGAFFVACFSSAFHRREDSYMHRELAWIAESMHATTEATGDWFIPVRLTECLIPDLSVGGESIRNRQWVDLFANWDDGIDRILRVVRPPTYVDPSLERFLRDGCARHIESKIEFFAVHGASRFKDVEDGWRHLMDPVVWNPTVELAATQLAICLATGKPVTGRINDCTASGFPVVVVTTAPTTDIVALLSSFAGEGIGLEKKYSHFIREERRRMREFLPGSRNRPLAHWIFRWDTATNELVVDLLYLLSYDLYQLHAAYQLYLKEKREPKPPVGMMHPTSFFGGRDMDDLVRTILQEEAVYWSRQD